MDIPKLLDYTCIVVAQQIRGKSPDEIRKVTNIPSAPGLLFSSTSISKMISPKMKWSESRKKMNGAKLQTSYDFNKL